MIKIDIKEMLNQVPVVKEEEGRLLLTNLNTQMIKLFQEKEIAIYYSLLEDVLKIAKHLNLDTVIKYFGITPVVKANESMQFQEIFRCLHTKERNNNWFLDFFSLYLGVSVIYGFKPEEIKRADS
ncbi:hypothetical protein [Cytobacillus kochii]|uniref:hypothetical protein n=1 Tax=Cytobacillus kochii TaxID=859143 RepID=UPI00402A62C4